MTQRVLIVGSVAVDDITTPTASHKGLLGGSAIYGSVAASRFSPVDIVGVAGDDFPDEYIRDLNAMGVRTDGLEIVAGGKTFHWTGEYKGEMNEAVTIQTDLGVFGEFSPAIPSDYRNDGFVFLGNIDPELQLTVLEQVARPKLTILDSMNLWINIKREKLIEVLAKVDVAILNDTEARMLFNTHSLPVAAEGLLSLGLKRAIVCRGADWRPGRPRCHRRDELPPSDGRRKRVRLLCSRGFLDRAHLQAGQGSDRGALRPDPGRNPL